MVVEIVLIVLTLILGYTTWVQFIKVESYEDLLEKQRNWIEEFISKIDEMTQTLNEIDSKGTFEADDEVGTFFKSLKDLQSRIDNFIEETIDGIQTDTGKETTQEEK